MGIESMAESVERILARSVRGQKPLAGGSVANVQRLRLDDGSVAVAKWDPREREEELHGPSGLEIEGQMLRDLAKRTKLPVPQVIAAEPGLLLLEELPGSSGCPAQAQAHAAELVAGLHAQKGDSFGYSYDTRIGGLALPNPPGQRFVPFFVEHRIMHFADSGREAGQLPDALHARVISLSERLPRLLSEPDKPSLLHGDLWSGNLLSEGDRITGVLDPALYFGHPEVDLAFGTLFETFDRGFFRHYAELTGGPDQDFFAERRHLWNLFPLLVHVRLFGGSYVADLERIVARFE